MQSPTQKKSGIRTNKSVATRSSFHSSRSMRTGNWIRTYDRAKIKINKQKTARSLLRDGVAAASLEEHLGVGGGLGAKLLQPWLGGGPHPEEPAEAAREPAEQAVGGAHAHQLPPHFDVVLLEVGEAHPHARHLELELPVLAPHRRVVVPRRHGAAAGPEEERRLVLGKAR
jgi:hypothetical protein